LIRSHTYNADDTRRSKKEEEEEEDRRPESDATFDKKFKKNNKSKKKKSKDDEFVVVAGKAIIDDSSKKTRSNISRKITLSSKRKTTKSPPPRSFESSVRKSKSDSKLTASDPSPKRSNNFSNDHPAASSSSSSTRSVVHQHSSSVNLLRPHHQKHGHRDDKDATFESNKTLNAFVLPVFYSDVSRILRHRFVIQSRSISKEHVDSVVDQKERSKLQSKMQNVSKCEHYKETLKKRGASNEKKVVNMIYSTAPKNASDHCIEHSNIIYKKNVYLYDDYSSYDTEHVDFHCDIEENNDSQIHAFVFYDARFRHRPNSKKSIPNTKIREKDPIVSYKSYRQTPPSSHDTIRNEHTITNVVRDFHLDVLNDVLLRFLPKKIKLIEKETTKIKKQYVRLNEMLTPWKEHTTYFDMSFRENPNDKKDPNDLFYFKSPMFINMEHESFFDLLKLACRHHLCYKTASSNDDREDNEEKNEAEKRLKKNPNTACYHSKKSQPLKETLEFTIRYDFTCSTSDVHHHHLDNVDEESKQRRRCKKSCDATTVERIIENETFAPEKKKRQQHHDRDARINTPIQDIRECKNVVLYEEPNATSNKERQLAIFQKHADSFDVWHWLCGDLHQ
jgi:hypothetical protein